MKKRIYWFHASTVIVLVGVFCTSIHAAGPEPAPFQLLKVGEVQPRGWLLEQIRADAAGGYGPALDKLTDRCEVPVFGPVTKQLDK